MKIPFQIKDDTIYLTADGSSYALATEEMRTRNGINSVELVPYKWFMNLGQALLSNFIVTV